jgi:hypothetical protein
VPEGQVRGNVYLPAENFCLYLLDGGDAILMTVWQSSQQDVSLSAVGARQDSGLCSSTIQCLKGKSIWLAFLESPGLWHARGASAKDDWKPPFTAKWRCSGVRENGVAESWDLQQGLQSASGRDGFHSVPDFKRENGDAVERVPTGSLIVYPIDRGPATPLTATCPTDVMRNTLGVGPCQYILACEGLAAQGDPTPNAVMNWVEKQFEGKKERRAADDIKERLQVMTEHIADARNRILRYAEFAGQVRGFLTNRVGAERFRSIVDGLDRFIAAGLTPAASPERAKQLATEVSALIGKENALPACQHLGEQLRSLGAIQDRTLARCRMAVRRLRAQGRTEVADQSPTASLAQEVQKVAEEMLKRK